MPSIQEVKAALRHQPAAWLITGVAGFIGSNLLEALLQLDQNVCGLDNLSTGHRKNLAEVESAVSAEQWARFRFIEGDIRDEAICHKACAGAGYVLHHAALGSVPLSIEKPLEADAINVRGTLNLLLAARDQKVKRFIYASSSAIYGDCPETVMVEDRIGRPLSPYAVTKQINELYAGVFGRCYGLASVGLRYFNVFGPRQDPSGAYAAVIPKWIAAFLKNEPIEIYGDGETSRDFCHIENVVQANLLAATTPNSAAVNQVYNIALSERSTLNQLFAALRDLLGRKDPLIRERQGVYRDFRPGDVRHSQADITRARQLLGYAPTHNVVQGLEAALNWYRKNLA
jgi:UDP-N-acetylglucosamine 4-epimerase